MDVLRKELEEFYRSQRLDEEELDYSVLQQIKDKVANASEIDNDCKVITDAAADTCYIFGGFLSCLLGLSENLPYKNKMDTSDEDVIYTRIHPEDLVDKRMLEYEYFKYIDNKPPDLKAKLKATCRIRIKDRDDRYIYVENSTRVIQLSPNGKVWLILCDYNLSPTQILAPGIEPHIINLSTGEGIEIRLSEKRSQILTEREKQILTLIKEGKLSKEIAGILNISINTVNRHRQNILEKLSVGNSVEAIMAATLMRLL